MHSANGSSYRLPNELSEFQEDLYVRLIDMKWRNLTKEPWIHRHNGRDIPYDAIMLITDFAPHAPVGV